MCSSKKVDNNEALENISESILQTLVQSHKEFRAFLSKRVANEAVADELLQQGLMRAVENARELQKDESVVAWFYRVLRNLLIDYYRHNAAEGRKHESLLRELTVQGESHVKPVDDINSAICACMGRLLPTLKPEYAELIRRIDLGEEDPKTVAAALGITPNNLSVRLHRARQALKVSLQRSCGTCTEHGCLDCTCE